MEASMIWLALLFGLLCAFGGLQSGVLAQDGGKLTYPRALERIELLVVSLNESLQEDLQEMKLSLNQTKKQLGEVQREKESLEAALLETRKELAATKTLHQQAIDELRATQDSGRVEALEDGLRQLRMKVDDLEDAELPRHLNELDEDLSEVKRDLRRLEDENLPRRLNELATDYHKFVIKTITAEFRHNVTAYKLEEELQRIRHKLAEIEVGEEDCESRIAMSALTEVKGRVGLVEGLLSNMTAAMERRLNATKANFIEVKSEVELAEKKLSEKVWNITTWVEDIQQHSSWIVADLNRTVHETSTATSQQWKSIGSLRRDLQHQNNTVTRLSGRVTQQDTTTEMLQQIVAEQEGSVNRLSVSILTQVDTTDNLTRTVAEQGVCIALLKHDVEQIKSGVRNDLSCSNSTSCKDLYQCDPSTPTGYYNISTPQGVRRVYCEMDTSNCGDVRGGWMRVAHINMTDPRHSCPQGLSYIVQSSKRMCARTQSGPGCSSVTSPQHGVSYTKVCGRARGYHYAYTEAFRGYDRFKQSLEGYYVTGLSVTHGSPRKHIWTFAAGVSNDRHSFVYQCPCGLYQGVAAPGFIGENYHCESGWDRSTPYNQWHLSDPLWDSRGCPVGSTCCDRGGPWFNVTLTEEVSDEVEVRWCHIGQFGERVGVDQLDIFVH